MKVVGNWNKGEKERIKRMIWEIVRCKLDDLSAVIVLDSFSLATAGEAGVFKVYAKVMDGGRVEWMRLWWTENKYLFEVDEVYDVVMVYTDWNFGGVGRQEAMRMLEMERFEKEYVDELRRLGLQFPEIEFVFDVDRRRRLAVVRGVDGRVYLCSKYGYWDAGYRIAVDHAWSYVFGKSLKEINEQDVDEFLMQRVMIEVFGGEEE